MTSPVVVAKGLRKLYGDRLALDGFDCEISPGDVTGFLGPNGAGKTTAIRILSTLMPATQGEFWVDGIPHTRPQEIRALIGMIPESSGYYAEMTGHELVAYFGRLHGQDRATASQRAAALLEEVGLAGRAETLVGTYSRGMRQRLGLARALVNDPRIVFLDEPTLGLDPSGQRALLELIARLGRDRQAAVVLCTHLLDDVEQVCNRLIIMDRGKVVASGATEDVIAQAASAPAALVLVAPRQQRDAQAFLEKLDGVAGVAPDPRRPGALVIELRPETGPASHQAAQAVYALSGSGIPVLRLEMRGSRVADAFFARTKEGDL
ncbi:MAG: ABC transporter ATP-binding protein [Thermoplasmatota archaeon]